MHTMGRRAVVKAGAIGLATLAGWPDLATAGATSALRRTPSRLVPDPHRILDLPEGFTHRVLARPGEVIGGAVRPGGAAALHAYDLGGGRLALCVGHDLRLDRVDAGALAAGDPRRLGGTTTLVLDRRLQVEAQHVSHRDSSTNLGGGPTPWGTWLACEGTFAPGGPGRGGLGFVHDVDPRTPDQGTALPALGQFRRHSVAIDRTSGVVYQTERRPDGLVYRFLPDRIGDLRTGRLEAMAVLPPDRGRALRVRWVDVTSVARSDVLRFLGAARGAMPFHGGEGVVVVDGAVLFGEAGVGSAGHARLWRHRPDRGTLELVHEAAAPTTATSRVVVTDAAGQVHTIARAATDGEVVRGACWDPHGTRLFVTMRQAGTLVVEGPFGEFAAARRGHAGVRRADPDQLDRCANDAGVTAMEVEATLALGMA